jgi:hypothetical protein
LAADPTGVGAVTWSDTQQNKNHNTKTQTLTGLGNINKGSREGELIINETIAQVNSV